MSAPVRFGMVGGGEGAFIGAVHRRAARLDGECELVCGAFSSDPERSRSSGLALGLEPSRCYPDYATMMRAEAARPAGERMQFVAIVTPNRLHLPVALEALRHGFHVLSDKPATASLDECKRLRDEVRSSGRLYALTHVYAAYPMVREAAARVAAGALGEIRKVVVEYSQGWLATPLEREGHKQAGWRLDAAQAGPSGCFGDIGVHAFNLAEHVTGLKVAALCCQLHRTVPGRALDDDGAALLRFDNNAHGVLLASQISVGEENRLVLRVYGDRGALEWRQEEPNTLWLKHPDRPVERLRAGHAYLGPEAAAATRLPAGHPEGYVEAFANLYRAFAAEVRRFPAAGGGSALPGIAEALRGMAFVEAAVAASDSPRKWHPLPNPV